MVVRVQLILLISIRMRSFCHIWDQEALEKSHNQALIHVSNSSVRCCGWGWATQTRTGWYSSSQLELQENRVAYESCIQMYLMFSRSRYICSRGIQPVPVDAGFVSTTGLSPQKLTTIDCYPMINEPITDSKFVKELLARCQRATEEVGQAYTITPFDLGVIMIAMPIIWEKPHIYSKHVVLKGSFHTIMNALKMTGHKMAGSGYAEILVEANRVTSVCL